jgi:hypothetical protein
VAACCEYGDEPAGSGAAELVTCVCCLTRHHAIQTYEGVAV